MANVPDKLYDEKESFGAQSQSPVLGLQTGAQWGYSPDPANLEATTLHVNRPVTLLLLEGPKAFDKMAHPERWKQALRMLIEQFPRQWEGFRNTVTVDTSDTQIDGSGQLLQAPTNITRARSELTSTYDELDNHAVWRFFNSYINNFIGDVSTKTPRIFANGRNKIQNSYLMSEFTSKAIAFESDITFTKVRTAWLLLNLYPLSSGELELGRDRTQAMEVPTIQVPWASVDLVGAGIDQLAQQVLDNMNGGDDPSLRAQLIGDVSSDIKALSNGLTEDIARKNSSSISI